MLTTVRQSNLCFIKVYMSLSEINFTNNFSWNILLGYRLSLVVCAPCNAWGISKRFIVKSSVLGLKIALYAQENLETQEEKSERSQSTGQKGVTVHRNSEKGCSYTRLLQARQ